MTQNNIILHQYNGFAVPQRSTDGYVNLTEMCKVGNKLIADWLRLKSSKEYLDGLSRSMNIPIGQLVYINNTGLNETRGTWGHKLVGVEVAGWINIDFKIWSNLHILELAETGTTSLTTTQPAQSTQTELMNLALDALDRVFAGLPIEQALVAGIKLNTAQSISPAIAPHIEPARQLLINSTAKQAKLLTVTALSKLLTPPLTAVKTNQLLIAKGYQVKNANKRGQKDLSYLPTPLGEEHSSITLATGATKSDTYQQLRWYDSIVGLL